MKNIMNKMVYFGIMLVSFVLSAVHSYADILPTEGLQDYRVYQRNVNNLAVFSFKGATDYTGDGIVEISVHREGQVGKILDWTECGTVDSGNFKAAVKNLPAGGPYLIKLRIKNNAGSVVDTGKARNILVGDLWILAGQSNMEGYGDLVNVASSSPQVHVFDMADRWLIAEEPLHWLNESVDTVHSGPFKEKARRPMDDYRQKRWKGAGLGLPFAKAMVNRTGIPIGLVACAHGGTSMDQWSPDLREEGGDSLYGSMYRRFLEVGGRVKGMLWYQGESDATPERAGDFKQKFIDFVKAVRKDFNQPNLPFYYVQIGRYTADRHVEQWAMVRDAQRVCENIISEPAGMAASIDLTLDDPIHISTEGLKVLAQRLTNLACQDLFDGETERGPRPVTAVVEEGMPNHIRISFEDVNGKLISQGRLNGFTLRNKQQEEFPFLYDQYIDPLNPNEVLLDFKTNWWNEDDLPDDVYLWYGYGNNPYCNLSDELNMAAPSFGPMKIIRE